MTGRISMLVSRDLAVLVQAARSLDPEVRKQLRTHTRGAASPIWTDEIRHQQGSRLQARVLVDTARASVTDSNVMLKSATIGRVHGTPASTLAGPAEFGANPSTLINTTSSRGKGYKRRIGAAFGAPRRAGKVFYPALNGAIPRIGALWFQTAYRTVAETFEKVSS